MGNRNNQKINEMLITVVNLIETVRFLLRDEPEIPEKPERKPKPEKQEEPEKPDIYKTVNAEQAFAKWNAEFERLKQQHNQRRLKNIEERKARVEANKGKGEM